MPHDKKLYIRNNATDEERELSTQRLFDSFDELSHISKANDAREGMLRLANLAYEMASENLASAEINLLRAREFANNNDRILDNAEARVQDMGIVQRFFKNLGHALKRHPLERVLDMLVDAIPEN